METNQEILKNIEGVNQSAKEVKIVKEVLEKLESELKAILRFKPEELVDEVEKWIVNSYQHEFTKLCAR